MKVANGESVIGKLDIAALASHLSEALAIQEDNWTSRQHSQGASGKAAPPAIKVTAAENDPTCITSLALSLKSTSSPVSLGATGEPITEADTIAAFTKDLSVRLRAKLNEGYGETLIHVGYNDDGSCQDLTETQCEKIWKAYEKCAAMENAYILPILDQETTAASNAAAAKGTEHYRRSCWALVRRVPESVQSLLEVRVAVVGNVDAGKSTMLGVLTSGALDDGRGRARVDLFKHKHEVETGRTSSIGQEILGFDRRGNVMSSVVTTNSGTRRLSWADICTQAHKIISFIDLAGHERYLKTTMFGLTGCSPDYVMLMVGANAGVIGMAKEHLALAFALNIPVFVVVTKVDMCPPNVLENTLRQLSKILKSNSCRRQPVMIRTAEETTATVQNFVSQRLCPIFQVSNVSGFGLPLLKQFLHLLPIYLQYQTSEPVEYQITETYSVPGVGAVVAGTLLAGTVNLGQTLYLGPDSSGIFVATQVKGIQRKKVNVAQVAAGQSASFALKKIKRIDIRKGMVLVSKDRLNPSSGMLIAAANAAGNNNHHLHHPQQHSVMAPALSVESTARSCREFEAEVVILFHSTTISPRYQAMLHCGVVRQTVSIVSMQQDIMRTGDRCIVRFRFIKGPEYLRSGQRLLFREGRTKGVGRIVNLFE